MTDDKPSRIARWIGPVATIGVVVLIIALLVPAVQQAREAARQTRSKNNLRQIGMALENYQEVYRQLPSGGIFDDQGTAYFSWTTSLVLYLSQRAWYDAPDPSYPWDDSVNLDHQLHEFAYPWQNPGVQPEKSPDGFPVTHYSGNQQLFYRNSVIRADDLTDKANTILVGECQGNFVPIGYPYNWRDLSVRLGISEDGFGCPQNNVTMFLLADTSVRVFSNLTDSLVVAQLMGPTSISPDLSQIAKPSEPYRLSTKIYWRYLNIVRAHKGLMTFRLSPDQKYLHVDFRGYDDPEEATPEQWQTYFQSFIETAPVEHVELRGHLRARELLPFLKLPALKRFTISHAKIEDDMTSVISSAVPSLVID